MKKKPISNYLDSNLVVFLSTPTRNEALRELVHVAYESGKLDNEELFYQAIIEREKIVSTGIGMGAAIPHAKLPSYDRFFIVIGILQKAVEWHALDGGPVRLIFLIGGPDDKQTEYLQLLSNLTQAIKNEERRKKLLTLSNPKEIIELFQET
ncbi:PTS sugar transporter subunit IIA [Candidatus Protochlamydia sp. R18]|uniref:PTS sugar transporter subunit IIA n=1 Tax=Candidatus Protochlamydia sp. R18 TaxID=1353977 RepID=UPI0005AB6C3F|nr:PTS sugar transporter subunit IIA [Candidatus Protochlamydia sp. R18]